MRKAIALLSLLISLTAYPFAFADEDEGFPAEKMGMVSSSQKIEVSPEGQKAVGLQVQTVALGSMAQVLKTTGQVQAAENRAYDITPRVSGVVNQVYAKQGDAVTAGQVLATIYSADVANQLTQLLQERARIQSEIARSRTQSQKDILVQANMVELSQANYQREQIMLSQGITARKDYQAAKNAYETAQVELSARKSQAAQNVALLQNQLSLTIGAVKSQLRVMGLSSGTIEQVLATNRVIPEVPVLSPVSGVITLRGVTLGQNLDPGRKIFSIVNLSPIWVIVNVFQENLGQIHLGQAVYLKTPDGQSLTGSISSIGTVVDPQTRALSVRIVADNPHGLLKPGMFVSAEITTGQTANRKIVVPATSLVEANGQTVVYVRKSNTAFQSLPVQTGEKTSSQVEILSGLTPGDQVVVQGASQLYAQSLIAGKEGGEEGEEHPPGSGPSFWLGILLGVGITVFIGLIGLFFLNRRNGTSRGR